MSLKDWEKKGENWYVHRNSKKVIYVEKVPKPDYTSDFPVPQGAGKGYWLCIKSPFSDEQVKWYPSKKAAHTALMRIVRK